MRKLKESHWSLRNVSFQQNWSLVQKVFPGFIYVSPWINNNKHIVSIVSHIFLWFIHDIFTPKTPSTLEVANRWSLEAPQMEQPWMAPSKILFNVTLSLSRIRCYRSIRNPSESITNPQNLIINPEKLKIQVDLSVHASGNQGGVGCFPATFRTSGWHASCVAFGNVKSFTNNPKIKVHG